MARRFFTNNFRDYEGSLGSSGYIRERVLAVLQIIANRCPASLPSDGGLYVGSAGIAFAFHKTALHADFADKKQEFLQQSLQYAQVQTWRGIV